MLNVRRDSGIRDPQNLRHAPVVHFDLKNLRVRITFRKFKNVFEIGPAPRVDRLRVVAHHHDVAVLARERVDEIRLDLVRVLIFIDQDELKLAAINRRDPFLLLQHRQCLFEQIIEIHRVGRFFLFLIARLHIFDLLEQRQEVGKLFREQFLHRRLRVHDEAENLREHIAFRKPDLFRINPRVGDHGIDQIFLIFAVHDGESAVITERAAVTAQHAIADGVKRSAPNPGRIDRQ